MWDATCINTFAASHLSSAASAPGAAAKDAEIRKFRKYESLSNRYKFQPVAFETAGACGPSTKKFVKQLGARVAASTGDRREHGWLWQRLSLAVVRGNATSILFTMSGKDDCGCAVYASRPEQRIPVTDRMHCIPPQAPKCQTSDLLLELLDIDLAMPSSLCQEKTIRLESDPLKTYRDMFKEMQAESDRDIMSDPELAPYLRW